VIQEWVVKSEITYEYERVHKVCDASIYVRWKVSEAIFELLTIRDELIFLKYKFSVKTLTLRSSVSSQ